MWKDIETIKKTVIDILPKSSDEPMKFRKVERMVVRKLGINTVRMKDIAEALRQLVKEDQIAYDDDLQYYIEA